MRLFTSRNYFNKRRRVLFCCGFVAKTKERVLQNDTRASVLPLCHLFYIQNNSEKGTDSNLKDRLNARAGDEH